MKRVKYCTECKWSSPDRHSTWTLRCNHPVVNSKDPWSLAATEVSGSSCRDEREKVWFATCGMSGKLWERK